MLLFSFYTPWNHQKARCFQGVKKMTSEKVKPYIYYDNLHPIKNKAFFEVIT